jgi:hypothetical protein
MTYINQARGMFRGQTLVTFRADDGTQLVLERDCVRYIDAAQDRHAERIVPKQNAYERMNRGSRVIAARGNNGNPTVTDMVPLNALTATYDATTGMLHISSPYADWVVEAGTEPRQKVLAQRFVQQVNAQVHAPKYVINDYDHVLNRAVTDDPD